MTPSLLLTPCPPPTTDHDADTRIGGLSAKDLLKWRWLCSTGVYHAAGNTLSLEILQEWTPPSPPQPMIHTGSHTAVHTTMHTAIHTAIQTSFPSPFTLPSPPATKEMGVGAASIPFTPHTSATA